MEAETNDMVAEGEGKKAPERFGPYTLYDEIGRGGMASVHLGKLQSPSGFSRVVAVKRMHPDLTRSPEFVEMFFEEARLVARIQHPNVVAALDCVAYDGTVLLVMEYVHGVSLDYVARLVFDRGARVPTSIAATIIVGAALGLDAAHRAVDEHGKSLQIVHRDVSPHNVLVGEDGIARVLDFGIAKAAERGHHTRTGEVKGKIGYMAPEQLLGGDIGPEADVYSLGVVMWELLTGRRLFGTDGHGPMLMKIANNQLDLPSSVNPNITPEVEAVVMKALARAPASRYRSAYDFACAIEECLPLAGQRNVGQWISAAGADELAHRSMIRSKMDFSMPSRIRSAKELVALSGRGIDGRSDGPELPKTAMARAAQRFGHLGVFVAGVALSTVAMIALGRGPHADAAPVATRPAGDSVTTRVAGDSVRAGAAGDPAAARGPSDPLAVHTAGDAVSGHAADDSAAGHGGGDGADSNSAASAADPGGAAAAEASSARAKAAEAASASFAASAGKHDRLRGGTRPPGESTKHGAGVTSSTSSAAHQSEWSLDTIGGRE